MNLVGSTYTQRIKSCQVGVIENGSIKEPNYSETPLSIDENNVIHRHGVNGRCRRAHGERSSREETKWIYMRMLMWGTRKALGFNENPSNFLMVESELRIRVVGRFLSGSHEKFGQKIAAVPRLSFVFYATATYGTNIKRKLQVGRLSNMNNRGFSYLHIKTVDIHADKRKVIFMMHFG